MLSANEGGGIGEHTFDFGVKKSIIFLKSNLENLSEIS